MPRDRNEERERTKADADRAASYFAQLLARGFSRTEALDATVAYVLGGMARAEEPDDREPWQQP